MQRSLTVILVSLSLLATAALAQGGSYDLEKLWRSGEFSATLEIIEAQYAAGDRSVDFLVEAAQAAEAMRQHQLAAALYAELSGQYGRLSLAYSEAKRREWRQRHLEAGEDTGTGWVVDAQLLVAEVLDETQVRRGLERQAALELEFALAQLLDGSSRAWR